MVAGESRSLEQKRGVAVSLEFVVLLVVAVALVLLSLQ